MLSWVRWCAVIVLKQKTAYEMRISDWSSDVCSSDLSDRRQHIEKFGETHRRVDQPRDLRIGRIDQKIFVGGVCARSVADAEMRGGDRQDRKSVLKGKSVSVRIDLGGRRTLKHKNQ